MPADTGDRRSRWQDPFTVFQTNLQEIDATMDVEAALDVVEDHGADTWLVNAGGISAFYPTDLPYHTRNPFLAQRPSGDLLGDAVTAAKRRGVRVLARLDLSKVAAPVAAEHPEWLFTTTGGDPQIYNGLYSTCLSGPYYQEHAVEILDEILDRYPVDGVFFNWFNFNERDYSEVVHGICHCGSCREGFAEFAGRTLPDDQHSPDFGLWRRYTEATIRDLAQKFRAHVGPRNTDLALIVTKGGSVVYQEGNNAFRHMPGGDFWPHATAEAVSAHVAARPDVPVVVNAAAHIDSTYRMGAEQPEHLAQYLIQGIARGGNPSIYILGAPGRLPMQSVAVARTVTRFHRQHRARYAALRPGATVGLVRPALGRNGYANHLAGLEEFRGVHQAMQQGHLPFDVLASDTPADLGADGLLTRYRLLVLPDTGPLDTRTARAIDHFVALGGRLLTTGHSGVADHGGISLECSPARCRIGAARSGNEVWSTYATLDEQPLAAEFRYTGAVVPIFGSNARYAWKPQATRAGTILAQAPWGPPELSYGHAPSGDPAVASIEFGAGSSTMITWTIGRTYREFGKTEVRDHLLAVLAPLADAPVSAQLPDQVEMILGTTDDGYLIHLINHTGARRRSYGPHVPVSGGRLFLRGATGNERVSMLAAKTEPAVHYDGDLLAIDLPTLDLFEVAEIRGARTATPAGRV